jgi:hypothetical protein
MLNIFNEVQLFHISIETGLIDRHFIFFNRSISTLHVQVTFPFGLYHNYHYVNVYKQLIEF